MSVNIHKTAIIGKNVELGDKVVVGPYCVIDEEVEIGDNTVLKNGVTIGSNVKIGKGNQIFSNAVVGSIPQDLKYKGEKTYLEIGDNNKIREFATINKGTGLGGSMTKIGDNNLLMVYSHVAHDCIMGSNIIVANSVSLAGHVTVDDNAIIGGLSGIHQFSKIGRFSIIGGMSRISRDVLPFCTVANKEKTKLYGINKIGLVRNNFSEKDRNAIQNAFRILLKKDYNIKQAVEELKNLKDKNKYVLEIIDFINNSERGVLC